MPIVRKIKKALIPVIRRLNWIPDRYFLSTIYFMKYGRKLHLRNPKRFTEWIQWYKINYRNSDMLRCVDKYEVRQYVSEKGRDEYLNRLYQVCNRGQDIDFEKLPNQFVIKTTSGSNGENILIVKDKTSLDIPKTIKVVDSWLGKDYPGMLREWAYSNVEVNPRIIIEEYLENTPTEGLMDYKFYCFNGKPVVCQLISDRFNEEHIDFYDMNWNRLDGVVGLNPKAKNSSKPHPIPKNLQQMISLATDLSKGFPYVRVDLYNVNGKIYFGELTFYPGSGFGRFNPDSFDFELGSFFEEDNSY